MEAPRMEMDGPRMEMGGPTLEMERPIPGAGGPSGLPHDPAPSLRDAAACHGPHETEERTIVAGSIYRGVEASGGVPGAGQCDPFAIVESHHGVSLLSGMFLDRIGAADERLIADTGIMARMRWTIAGIIGGDGCPSFSNPARC